MMIGRVIGKRTTVPDLVVSQRVIDKMIGAAKSYLEDETGEAMVGLVVESTHSGTRTLYVLDTIAPDASAVRHYATFQQGDEHQDEILYWWRENWRAYRAALKPDNPLQAKWNVPLHHLGDWHKQPGSMIHPSGGDLATALEWISDADNKLHFMLAPIVTLGPLVGEQQQTVSANHQIYALGEGMAMRVDWWYIDLKSRGFLPITPTIYPAEQLPPLPAAPWHLTDETRFDLECRRLTEHGMFLSLTLWDSDDKLPLEVCLLAARADWDHMLLLVTPPEYPAQPPSARIAPFVAMNADDDLYAIFEQAWEKSEPVTIDPGEWNADRWLIDYVKAIAAAKNLPLDVKIPEKPADAPVVTTDPPADDPPPTATKEDDPPADDPALKVESPVETPADASTETTSTAAEMPNTEPKDQP